MIRRPLIGGNGRSLIGGNGWPGSLGVSTKDGGVNIDLNCLFRILLFDEQSVCIQATVTSESFYTQNVIVFETSHTSKKDWCHRIRVQLSK